jgi:ATP-dependent helicase Lhr and Lhr-like helicase
VRDPLGDLVGRYARTHGPFRAADVAARLGLGVAVVASALERLATSGRLVQGEFSPAGYTALGGGHGAVGTEWCDAEVLRAVRRRSLAALRREVEPVAPGALGRFVPAWQGVGERATRGVDGVARVIEQLAGLALPASALETLVLPSRVVDYSPGLLDELTLAGEVVWAGAGGLGAHDCWVALAPAELAPLVLPLPDGVAGAVPDAIRAALEGGQAMFFRALATHSGSESDEEVTATIWDLIRAGLLTNDTLAPVRAMLAPGNRTAHSRRPRTPRTRYGRYSGLAAPGGATSALRPAPFGMGGRWSAVPQRTADPTLRALAAADVLLDRHGVLTRGAVAASEVSGGFAAVYPVLKAAEESGRVRRGYFVEGLGAAQFALPGAVDRLRAQARPAAGGYGRASELTTAPALVLAATDPANPYGAALPWPAAPPSETGRGHQPARKAGALTVLVDGACVLYVERGGRTLLTWSDDAARLHPAAHSLSEAGRRGALGRITVEKADGAQILGGGSTPLREALDAAGFVSTPRGLRLRG